MHRLQFGIYDNPVVIVFYMLHFYPMVNIINITPAYRDINRGSECIRHSVLRITMTEARRNKLTLDEKINLIDASRTHTQRLLVE